MNILLDEFPNGVDCVVTDMNASIMADIRDLYHGIESQLDVW